MPEIREILVINHTHTDVGYTHPQPVFWDLSRRFIDEALDLCEETADWPEPSRLKWTCEVTSAVMDWLHHATDQEIERFIAAAKRGQIAVGAMFCNMTPLYSLEQFAQSLLPVKTLREDYGLPVSVAINHDVNGLPWSFVPVLRDAHIEGLIMGINIHFGGFPLKRPMGFHWEGPDGRAIPAFNGEHYQKFDAIMGLGEPEPSTSRMAEGWDQYLARLREKEYPYDFVYLTSTHPHFCDNNPPNPSFPRLVRQWNEEGREPTIRIVTPDAVTKRLLDQPGESVSTHRGDWTDYWNFGAGSAALEMGVNRAARRRLHAAQMLATISPMTRRSLQHMEDARWNLNLYDEHTWGSFCGILSKLPTLYHDMWTFKAAYAWTASSLSAMLIRDLLDQVAGNPKQGEGISGYLLYNPGPVDRTVCFTVDKHFASGTYHHLCSTLHRLDTEFRLRADECEVYGIDAVTVGPIEVPAFSIVACPSEDFKVAENAPGIVIDEATLESPYHRLQFDPATGRVVSLLDKTIDRELVDHESPWGFFDFVRETVAEYPERAVRLKDQREAFFKSDWQAIHEDGFGWISDWKANRTGPPELISTSVEHRPDGVRFVRRYRVEGADDFVQSITLCAFEPTVRLEAFFKKEDVREPEGIYFALPFALPGWRAHFDTAGIATEYDAEQLPGVCRDWITADSYIAMHNTDWCVTVASPDAPLFQPGGFNFGRHQMSRDDREQGLLLAWAMNNYWHTNFRPSQPGYCRFRYEIRAAREFDPWSSSQFGRAAASPVELHPIVPAGNGRTTRLVEINGDGVTLENLKPAEVGGGFIARLVNHRNREISITLRLAGQPISRAFFCGTLEDSWDSIPVEDGTVSVAVPARGVCSIRLLTGD